MKVKNAALLIGFILLLFTAKTIQAQTDPYLQSGNPYPQVTSDKNDYLPGETAIITGSGWLLDSLVVLHLEEEPTYDQAPEYHNIQVDANGNFRFEYPIESRHLGVAFTVIAEGKQTGTQATAYFTDGVFQFAASGLPLNTNVVVYFTVSGSGPGNGNFETNFNTPQVGGGFVFNKTITVSNYTLSPAQAVNYSIINYTRRLVNGNPSNTLTNSFFAGDIGVQFTANFGALIVNPLSQQYGGNCVISATLYTNYQTQTAISGKVINFSIGGVSVGQATTNSNGLATVTLNLGSRPVGNHIITASFAGDSNYFRITGQANLTISPATLTVTANNKTRTYGTANPTFQGTVTGQKNNESFTTVYETNAGMSSPAGNYNIVPSVTGSTLPNYTLVLQDGILEVTKALLVVTAEDKNKTYGDVNPVFTVNYAGFLNGDNVDDLTTAPTGISVATNASPVGTYDIIAAGGVSSNYDFSLVNGTLTVGQRSITITADAQNKTYGDTDPALTALVTNGNIVNGDLASGTLSRAAGENVGAYAISKATYTYGSNYNETFEGANLVIGQRAITITADAQIKTYGDADPALTAQVTSGNIVRGDMASGALSRAAGENVGSYAISKATYTYGSNYNETYAGANLVIGQRAITITADAQNKYCGQNDPTLTYQITSGSLVSPGDISGVLTRLPGESAGNYSINQGTVSLSTNYSLTYVSANLTINGITVDANANSTPQAITSTITLKATVSPAALGIPVKFYLDNVLKGTVETNASGFASISIGTLATNVYEVKAVAGSGCSESVVFLPIYDPNGGFVTGGGWINSPAGSYKADPLLTGKANFGFVAKYKKGSTIPEGNTEFQFHAGNMNFNSSAYDDMRLVIAGSKANYKGTGKINGAGNYGFLVSAIDGQVNGGGNIDKFRIKIWDRSNGDQVVYDNNMGADENDLPTTVISGGSIVIHEVKGGKLASTSPLADNSHEGLNMKLVEPVLEQKIKLGSYPNPFGKLATITFTLPTDEQAVTLDVYDLRGSRIKRLYEGKAAAQQTLKFEFNGSNLSPGMYLLRLTTPKKVENFKMIMTE